MTQILLIARNCVKESLGNDWELLNNALRHSWNELHSLKSSWNLLSLRFYLHTWWHEKKLALAWNGSDKSDESQGKRKFVCLSFILKNCVCKYHTVPSLTSFGREGETIWAYGNSRSTLRASAAYVDSAKSFLRSWKKFYVVKNANKFPPKSFVNLYSYECCWSLGRKM